MVYKTNVVTDIEISELGDLKKLGPLVKEGALKVNKSQIARELGRDRRTVGKYIDGYEKPSARKKCSKIDAYYGEIEYLLSDETKQIFYYKRVLWQFLVDNKGLECAESSFRRYISRHAEFDAYFQKRRGTVSQAPSHMRYETEAGRQAQMDWKEKLDILLDTGETITVNVFVLLLSYSRFRIYRLSVSKTQDILFSFLDDAFGAFGGVPGEILTDNMKTVMDEARTEHSGGKVNHRFQQFADDYGFRVRPCIAGRPQTKAKVESPMKLLDELYAYNGLLDYDGLMRLVEKINNRVNGQVNGGTGKVPLLYFQNEKALLSQLPAESIRKAYRIATGMPKVNASSMVSYLQNQYSVPPEYIGKRLCLQVYDGYLHLYHNTKLVAIHRVSEKKLNYLESHYMSIAALTLNGSHLDIHGVAKENLRIIGEVYGSE